MSSSAVYEGAVAPKDPSRNGLFKGMKFWVGHRVPMRLYYVQAIQNNGGHVVPLEKNADYLISDHLKKGSPPGSYSYKWIEDSVKVGALQNREDYVCNPASRQSNPDDSVPTSSAAPQKHSRTGFTAEDDLILARWVTAKERKGEPTSGNVIYKELEAKYPHHPFQSWRDRWIRKVQFLPRPKTPSRSPSPAPTQTAAPAAQPSPKAPASSRPRRPSSSSANPQERSKFTKEDDEILIEYIRECIIHKKPTSGVKIFRDLANDFPQHTDQSWRSRWVKQLAPKLRDKIAQWESEDIIEEVPEERSRLPQRRDVDGRRESSETRKPRKSHQTRNSADNNSDMRRTNTADEARTSPTASPAKEDGGNESEDENQQYPPAGDRTTPRKLARESSEAPTNINQSPPQGISMENQFYNDYQAYINVSGLPFVPFHTIKGNTFKLWDLWQAVASQKMDPSERDWQQISEELGFDWIQHSTVPDEIRRCYETHLSAFEECYENFEINSEDDSEAEDENEHDNDEDIGPEALALPSSPPTMPSLKRPFDALGSPSDQAYPQPSNKRRKIDRDTEIPSTPDRVNGTSRLRHQGDANTSPSARPLIQHVINDDAEEGEPRDTVSELPALPAGEEKFVEPETQYFSFEQETQKAVFKTRENLDLESQCNITPSQQLHQESDAISPDMTAASPTPKAMTQIANPGTPTPRRSARIPFQQDSDDEAVDTATTNLHNQESAKTITIVKAKRRSLPKSFARNPSPTSHISASPPSRRQIRSPLLERPRTTHRPTPAEETPDDIIDHFCSLGYPKAIVLQALRATTWRLGDAGQVMEILKRGEELPQRTHGVWTQRDDESLKLVTSDEPPRDEKEARKRARAQRRLEQKHGLELMELRRRYLWEVV